MSRITKASNGDVQRLAYDHVAQLVFGVPLAVWKPRADQIGVYLRHRMTGESDIEVDAGMFDGRTFPASAEAVPVQDNIAQLRIAGTFVPKRGVMDALSGLVSFEETSSMLRAVASRRDVRGLVIAMESPGGSVTGVTEAAKTFAAITKEKPIMLVADHKIASAAFWWGATAEGIFLTADSFVGSVGALLMRLDTTAADKQAGNDITFFSSGARKTDGNPQVGLTEDEAVALQALVDQAAGMFFKAVASARGLSVKAVRDLQGAIFMGQDAIDAKLADEIGTVDDAVAALATKLNGARRAPKVAAHSGGGAAMPEAIETQTPAAESKVVAISADVQKARDEGAADARKQLEAERQEIAWLAKMTGHTDQLAEWMAEGLSLTQVREKIQAASVAAEEGTDTQAHVGAQRGGKKNEQPYDGEAVYRRRAEEAKAQSCWGRA